MKTTTKLMLIAMLAFAAGGTCPSDVTNDGIVGINDFLQVLGDWGPCPSPPRLVDAFDGGGGFFARLWSDGTIEEFDAPAGVPDWSPVLGGAYMPPPDIQAASLQGTDTTLVRAWSDGTVERLFRSDDGVPWDTDQWQIVGPR